MLNLITKIYLITCILSCGIYFNVNANELPTTWYSSRSLAIGGSGVASLNDETSVFVNPAGLTRARNPKAKKVVHRIRLPLPDEYMFNKLALSNIGADPSSWVSDSIYAAQNSPGTVSAFTIQSFPSILLGTPRSNLTLLIGVPVKMDHSVVFTDPEN